MDSSFQTPRKILDLYRNGFVGAICDEEDVKKLLGELPMPVFGAAAYDLKNSGKDKLSLPFKCLLDFDPNFGPSESQTTGDCQNGSDLVRMADGSVKMIKDIQIGEYVISANGNKKRVLNTIKKPYDKKMVQIKVDGYHQTIASTPDHRYIIDPINMEYKAIAALEIGDSVYLPSINHEESDISFDMINYFDGEAITEDTDTKYLKLEPVSKGKIRAKNGRSTINRYIKLDEKLSWLVGLYAAEGGVDGVSGKQERITYNLGSHEAIVAEQVKQYFKDIFDIDARLYQIPSKPTVIYVRINSVFIANLFKSLCYGNTYSKGLDKKFFITTKSNKLALLKGWFDGDGHKGKYRSVAVSVSKQLVTDFADIANSVNLSTSVLRRKARIKTKECYTLNIKSEHSNEFNISKGRYVTTISNSVNTYNGRMVRIKDIKIVEPEDKFVYCIEVEDDHNFICNGYGISNCVSHATRNAVDVTRAVEIKNGDKEEFLARGATEGIYQSRGHSGQGMTCSGAARYVSQTGGILLRKDYGAVNLSVYNSSLGANSRIPESVYKTEAQKHQVKTVSNIRTIEEARDALANGYALSVCSGYGFSSKRDANGIAKRSGGWSHAMAWIACDDTRERFNEILFLVQNSWGVWNSGPKVHDQPEGSFWIREADARGMLAEGGAWVFSDVNGFPPRKIIYSNSEVF